MQAPSEPPAGSPHTRGPCPQELSRLACTLQQMVPSAALRRSPGSTPPPSLSPMRTRCRVRPPWRSPSNRSHPLATGWSRATGASSVMAELSSTVQPAVCTSTRPSSQWLPRLTTPATGCSPPTEASWFGDAIFYGSTGGMHLNAPIVGMAPTPDGGDTGSSPQMAVSSPSEMPTSMDRLVPSPSIDPLSGWPRASTDSDTGLVASDGGIFDYGDAGFFGSTGGLPLHQPIVAMTTAPDGGGYWLVASNGGIFKFGDVELLSDPPAGCP